MTTTNAMRMLMKANIPFETSEYEVDESDLSGVHAAAAVAMCARSGGVYALNVAGALLFYLSDAILLAGKYGAIRGKRVPLLIWLTYVPAQLCLMLGFFLSPS